MSREKLTDSWHRFLHWPGWTAWLKWKGWKAIGHWSGWTAWLKWPLWGAIGRWQGWKQLLFPQPVVIALMGILSAAGLIWVFGYHQETSLMSYPLYCAAFYTLVILCARIPGAVKTTKAFLDQNSLYQKYHSNESLKLSLFLYRDQAINAFYGIFKTASGIIHGSAWIGADGLYNLAQAMIQLVQILRRRKTLPLKEQWKSYRLCGWLVLILHLTMTGPVFQMIRLGRAEEYPGYLIFVTALFTFYKLIHAFVDVAKDRKHKAPIDSAVRLLDLSQAFFAMFSLQVAMIHQFEGTREFASLMNTLTGSTVCLLVACMGIYMLRRARKAIKQLEESHLE